MLSNLIRSKTRQAILSTLFTNPEKEYYTRQLASLHHMSVGTLHREVRNLASSGVLNVRDVGNIKLFSLNKKNPIYGELKSIIAKTEGAIKLLRDVLSRTKGVKAAFVYGSFAKGDERPDSDVDLFLIGDAIDDDKFVLAISALEKRLFREINCTRYTENEYAKEKKRKNSFILETIKAKKIFLKGNENDL